MKIKSLKVNTKQKKYSIYFNNNLINEINEILDKENLKFEKFLIVYDSKIKKNTVEKIFKKIKAPKKFKLKFFSSETNKNFKNVNVVIKYLLKEKFSRNDCVISLGGGIVGDLCSFAASIFKRGTKFINIPTTLLAQVDASIGGKTGINDKKHGKNLIGTFYQPDLVLIDINFLKTLNSRELICGYAEIFKHSLISSKQNFYYLDKYIKEILLLRRSYLIKAVIDSCKIKKEVVEKDEKEKNLRQILNLGHTFGHAFEAACNYKKILNHGEAVILGVKTAVKFSLNKKYLSKTTYNKIMMHIEKIDFKLSVNKIFKKKDINKILNFMLNDKKNVSNKINLVLLKDIGLPIINKPFHQSEIKKFFLKELINL